MAELSTIARPYADALFSVAQAQRAGDSWLPLLEELAAVVRQPPVALVVNDPKLTGAQVMDLLASLVKGKLPDGMSNFLGVLIENGRLAALPEVARQFRQLKNQAEGVADCVIESAFEINEAQVKELVAGLTRKFGLKLKPEVKVDPGLIGGVRVSVGDHVLDTSVKTQLARMHAALTSA